MGKLGDGGVVRETTGPRGCALIVRKGFDAHLADRTDTCLMTIGRMLGGTMRGWRLTGLLLLLSALACEPAAQREEPGIDPEAEIRAVSAVVGQFAHAVKAGDVETASRLVAREPKTLHFGIFGDPIFGWEDAQRFVAEQAELIDEFEIERGVPHIKLHPSGTMAWATQIWLYSGSVGGQGFDYQARCTWILEKQNGEWKIIHFHISNRTADLGG